MATVRCRKSIHNCDPRRLNLEDWSLDAADGGIFELTSGGLSEDCGGDMSTVLVGSVVGVLVGAYVYRLRNVPRVLSAYVDCNTLKSLYM